MQALVGLLSFSLLLATGTCLKCESCSGFKEDCTGQLELCGPDQDTCATILTETKIGKVTSFTAIKSCYHSSKCLGSSKENSFIKVNVKIECSSSPAGKMKSEEFKAPENWSNKLPENRLLAEVFSRPKSRAANSPVDTNPDTKPSPNPDTKPSPNPDTNPDTKPSPNPDTKPSPKPDTNPDTKPSPKPDTNPDTKPSPKPDTNPDTKPSPNPDTKPSTPEKPKSTEKPKTTTLVATTTPDNAQQMAASFLLALSSLLLMNILL